MPSGQAPATLAPGNTTRFPVRDYDLATTLTCGQAFRWTWQTGAWEGIVQRHWVRLRQETDAIVAETAEPTADWRWLADYLQVHVDLAAVLATLPPDACLVRAVAALRGLRLLRQPPWECLASFILSSTKQIVQIRQVIQHLCDRFGEPVRGPAGAAPLYTFPTAERLAGVTEEALRACRMGFRARYLRAAAQAVTRGDLDLPALGQVPLAAARGRLTELPGVGPKIADCVLLFAYGFRKAFPVDVWVERTLRQLYFRGRRVAPSRLRAFAEGHFGPHAGYAQQYLFHHARLTAKATP